MPEQTEQPIHATPPGAPMGIGMLMVFMGLALLLWWGRKDL